MIEKVLPSIRDKWPIEDSSDPIFIQQRNAPTHIDPSDPIFVKLRDKVVLIFV